MQVTTLAELFKFPTFIYITLTIIFMIANILVGVSIIPQDKRKKGYKVHRIIYYIVLFLYGLFLWESYSNVANEWLNYMVLTYFLFAIPITRRINITLHAVIASLGLVLLIAVASFNVL